MKNKKIRKSALVTLLAVSMLFGLGTGVASGESADEEIDLDAIAELIDEATLVTEEEALSAMKLMTEKGDLQLYVNEATAAFALRLKSTGYIWWSSPINAENDPLAMAPQIRTMTSPIYVNSGDPQAHRTTKVTAADAIKKGGLKTEKITDGVKFTLRMETQGYTIPYTVKLLDDGSLEARVIIDEIVEDKADQSSSGAILIDLSFLSHFGAAGLDEDGYIIVPDGSGAVINFNNQKTLANTYKGQVYGRDYSVGQLRWPSKNEQVYLPMFSIVKKGEANDNALLVVAAEGDENAVVRASVAGQSTTSYNAAWFDFQLRTTDSFFMAGKNSELVVYETGKIKTGDIAVRYYPMSAENLDYADVADKYRSYLINEMGVTQKATANDSPFYLTLYGGTMKQQSVLGIPVTMQTIATSYSQAETIVKELTDKGVKNLDVIYKDFNTSGVKGEVNSTMDYSGKLGGKKDYNSLLGYIVSNGGTLSPSFNFMEFYSSGSGYSYMLNSSKQVTKAIAVQTPYEYAFGTATELLKPNWTILSPYYFSTVFEKMASSLKKEGATSVSLDQATYRLYSDFSRKTADGRMYYNRKDTAEIIADGMKKLKDNGISIIAQSANAYALPYVDRLTDIPLYSSNYDIFDYDIPFYEMVIHGLIPYTTKARNASSDAESLMLMSMVTGTPLHYEMMYNSPKDFEDSRYDAYYYSKYNGWVDIAANEYKMYSDVVTGLSDKYITKYDVISTFERESTFSDGTKIYIDIQNNILKVNGSVVDKHDYGLKGEADYVK